MINTNAQPTSTTISTTISPVSRDQFLPLSLAQQRLWFLHQMEPDSPNYNLRSTFRLSGFLNIQILEQALNEIVAHHEILRTRYIFENDNPRQIINPPQSVVLKIIDLEEYSETELEEQIQQRLDRETCRPFSLALDSILLRGTLLQLNHHEHILQLVVHQIAADTFSMRIIWEQLLQIYKAYLDGDTNPLPEPSIQFADFAAWKKEWLSGEVLNDQIKYWKKQLAGANPVLELPSDRPRPIAHTYVGATLSSRLSLSDSLRQFAHREGVNLYVTLLTALQILLYRYSGQEDISIGSPIAGRHFPQVTELIGFFVNTLVLRTDLSGNPTFQDLLARVSTTHAEAEKHQDLPFKTLVEEIQIERSLSYNPLFQVMFSIETDAIAQIELPDLIAVPLYLENKTAKFDLDISVIEHEDQELIVLWNYNTDLFNADTIARMSEHFQILLTGIIVNPQQSISQLPLLSPSELQQLLVEWNYRQINSQTNSQNNSQTSINKYVHQLFEQQVEKSPEAIAVEFLSYRLTYRELNAKANQLAHYLRSLNEVADMANMADTFVGICIERSLEMLVAILGILKAGAAYVPLDPSYPPDRLAYMIEDAKIAILLTQENLAQVTQDQERSQLFTDQTKAICLDSDWEKIAAYSQENPTNINHIEDLAYVIYTSGSTGKPKGVMISHQALINFTQTAISEYQITVSDRLLQFASINFDAAIEEIFPSLCTGSTLILRTVEMVASIPTFLRACIDLRITVLNLPTAYFHQLTSELNDRLPNSWIDLPESLRMVIIGGEAALPQTIRAWQEYVQEYIIKSSLEKQNGDRFQLINTYGPTETTVTATIYKIPSQPITGEVPIGRPMPHLQTYILDHYLQPVPIGVSGELHIGGASLARGYLHRPELTEEKFIPNPFSSQSEARLYKTGDLARYRPDGNIEFLGRIDTQVKIRGFRIELGEIESILIQSPIIREVAVTVNQDLSGNKRIFAYVVLHNALQQELLSNEQSPTNQLRNYLQNLLPKYMIPNVFIYLDDLPLTPSGKVDRRALAFLSSSEISNQVHENFVAPRDEVERQLAKIWTALLGVNHIGIYDNFFDLGGHSLLSMRLVAAIEKSFRYQIPVKLLFQISTIAEIAEWIRERPFETYSTEETLGLSLEDYRALLSHSAGKTGMRLGKRGLIISIPPESQVISQLSGLSFGQLSSIQPFVWIGEVKTGKRLKLKQPLYVMPGASLSSSMNYHKDYISTIASLLVDELLTAQPASSYALGGWCYNGLVAMEMAQQLIKLDKKVDLLTLIDMSGKSLIYCLVDALNFYWGTLRFHLFNLANLSLKQKWQYIKDRLIKCKIISSKHTSNNTFLEGIEMEGKSEVNEVVELLAKPVREYKPTIYSGRILLIIGNEQIVHGQRNIKHFDVSWLFPRNGWGNLLQGEVFVSKLQCDHLDLMESPYCEEIGNIIQEIILPSQSRNSDEGRSPATLFLGFIFLLL